MPQIQIQLNSEQDAQVEKLKEKFKIQSKADIIMKILDKYLKDEEVNYHE